MTRRGDFAMSADGRLRRRAEREVVPFVYAGAAILAPALFKGAPDGRISPDACCSTAPPKQGRLHGLRIDGIWMHVGTPEAVAEAESRHDGQRGLIVMCPALEPPCMIAAMPNPAARLHHSGFGALPADADQSA